MTHLCLTKWADRYDERVVLFANTGEENEQTLEFVHNCDTRLGFNTVWLEADIQKKGEGTTHNLVTFETASRRGEPYEAFIQKFGIPNQKFPQCTRELKARPIRSYIRSLGWGTDYDVAIGIRADESHRRTNITASGGRVLYPFLDWQPMTKPDVNAFWVGQPFRLDLAGYQGNCKWCWKKSFRKLCTIMDENPTAFDFPARMEALYDTVGPEFSKKEVPGYKRTFFRGNLSVQDIRDMHATGDWTKAENDAIVTSSNKEVPMDTDAGCKDSCEVNPKDML